MRIAILSSNLFSTPADPEKLPPGHAAASETIMAQISEGMVARGHEVTLFASGDSQTSASLVSVRKTASILDPLIGFENHQEFEHLLISRCYQMAKTGCFDLIHSVFDTRSAYYAGLVQTPTVVTLHSPLEGTRKMILSEIPKTQWYVSISNAQRKGLPDLRYVANIYHGLDLTQFSFGEGKKENMLIVGRIHPKKGILEAALVARKIKKPLWILGSHANNKEPYWQKLSSLIDQKTVFSVGMISKKEVADYYRQAKLFLFPLQWEEPFGLVMIEAMACGTPVVAFARGSVPEIVVDGETGYIVNSSETDKRGDWIIKKTGLEGIKEAVEKIYALPQDQYQAMRRACRIRVEKFFTVERMVSEYEAVYKKILQESRG